MIDDDDDDDDACTVRRKARQVLGTFVFIDLTNHDENRPTRAFLHLGALLTQVSKEKKREGFRTRGQG